MPAETQESLLARLLALPPAERMDHLRRACEGDVALRDRFQELAQTLRSLEPAKPGPDSLIPASKADRARLLGLAFSTDENSSTLIGPYKLLQKIGEGGFGVVWMAEQQFPVRRRVALKVIKRGMDTREVIARFESERQALALMDHPNIARVLDAGETDRGQPYFVMELVRGIPITKYCDENRLPTEARLQLFIAVCHAVQHAHQKGVIHRDLKPSNIIVTLHDGTPVPKIIDFGIAKATQGRLTDKTLFTQFHAFLGTPAYSSPEQMEMSGLDVDTRSDIYSLGILLYELLAGRPPFDPDKLVKAGLEEMRRTIREVDPPRPSQCLRTLAEGVRTTVAQQRGTDPARLSVLLRDDLDWIVMHCLEKDRTRRYDTATALADDVRHHLNNEPVLARPPSASDRLHKLIRRHRLAFAAGTAIAFSLIAGLVASSILLLRERAALQRSLAAETTSAHVARFMTDMLDSVAPSVALGRDTALLSDVLDKTAQRLETELRDEPAVAARLQSTLGAVYRDLGRFEKAESLLRQAIASYRTLPEIPEKELASAIHNLGDVLKRRRHDAEAETLLREALAIRRRVLGHEHVDVASTLYHLSGPVRNLGRLDEYEALRREALAMRRKLLPPDHPDVATSLFGLGTLAREQRRMNEAESLFRESLVIRRKAFGNEHPDVAETLSSLGVVLQVQEKWDEAIATFRESFAIRQKMLGEGHPDTRVPFLRLIALLSATGRDDEAVVIARDALARQRQAIGDDALETAPTMLVLAAALGDDEIPSSEAHQLNQRARHILKRARSSGKPLSYESSVALRVITHTLYMLGAPQKVSVIAEEAYLSALFIHGPDNINDTLTAAILLAAIQLEAGKTETAIKSFEEALKYAPAMERKDPHKLSRALLGMGIAYREGGRIADSQRAIDRALALRQWNTDPADPEFQMFPGALYDLGAALNQASRFAEAEPAFRNALHRHNRGLPKSMNRLEKPRALLETGLGVSLTGLGKFAEAEPILLHAYEDLKESESSYGADAAAMMGDALQSIVSLYTRWDKPDKAAAWREKISATIPSAHE